MAPAIGFARDGFPVAELMADEWQRQPRARCPADPATAATFLPDGKPPKQGDIFANPRLARTLDVIAKEGRDAFYKGSIARAIVADIKSRDGLLEMRDFADHKADWVDPISVNYRGYDVLEMPPSTQGFVALEMLNIMEGLRHQGAGPQHRRLPARGDRSQAHRVRRSRRVSRRSRSHAEGRAEDGCCRRTTRPTRRKEIDMNKAGATPSVPAADAGRATSPARISATRST